jgi:hypothetical protein
MAVIAIRDHGNPVFRARRFDATAPIAIGIPLLDIRAALARRRRHRDAKRRPRQALIRRIAVRHCKLLH